MSRRDDLRVEFTLLWDDTRCFAPLAIKNADGSVTRGQVYHANPAEYIERGFVPVKQWASS